MQLKYRCARYEEEHTSGGEKILHIYQNPAGNVNLTFNVTPTTATLTIGGVERELTNGSCVVPVSRNAESIHWIANADGYTAKSGTVIPDADKTIDIVLERESGPTPEPAKGNIKFNITPTDATLKIGDSASSLETVDLTDGSYTITDRLVAQPLYYEVSKYQYITQFGNVTAIENDTRNVNIDLVANRSLSTLPSSLSYAASNPTSMNSQVSITNISYKFTTIPDWLDITYKASESGTITMKTVTTEDVFDSTKNFTIVPNSDNTSATPREQNIVVTSIEDPSLTATINVYQEGIISVDYTYTVLSEDPWDSLDVYKVVETGGLRRDVKINPSSSNNVFTVSNGDQIYAVARREGYQDATDGQSGQPITITANRT